MNDPYDDHIEKMIREAREKGAFDGLPGKGKPIQWDDDALVPDDQRMANQIMKNAGFAPEWVQEGRQIEQDYQTIRAELRLARDWRASGRLDEAGWQAARARYTGQITALNRRIQRFNMNVPSPQLQRGPYDPQPPAEP